jgi:hypothetical protein
MSELKQSEDLKLKLIKLVSVDGCSVASAARQLNISTRTAQEFYAGDNQWSKLWWENYEKELEYYSGFGYDKPKVKADVQLTGSISETGLKIIVIADTQCKPEEDLDYMSWIGKFVNDKKPDVVVHIGDHFDVPSLSSYDKGKKSFEGRRLKADLEAGRKGIELFQAELDKDYNPRLVFCLGNHEQRIDRLANDMPELDGFVGTDLLPLKEMGWEVYDFLRPVNIGGIFFVHYLANPFSGKPYGGSALNQLKTVGNSFVVGHKQCLDVAIRPTLDGKHQIGIVNGACYPFDENYKGIQGNNHFRGLTVLHEVKDGFGTPMFVSLDFMKGRYA